MKKKLFIILAIIMTAAALASGGDNMSYESRRIQMTENSSFSGFYTSFSLSCENGQYRLQGEETGRNKYKKIDKLIPKKLFDGLYERCLDLDVKKISEGSVNIAGRDGSDVTLVFGSLAAEISISVWSPYSSVKERNLDLYMEIYSEILKLAAF